MARREIRLHFRTFPEEQLWVGECIELDIASDGDTEEEAFRNALEATQQHLEVLDERGGLDQFLRANLAKSCPTARAADPSYGRARTRSAVP